MGLEEKQVVRVRPLFVDDGGGGEEYITEGRW